MDPTGSSQSLSHPLSLARARGLNKKFKRHNKALERGIYGGIYGGAWNIRWNIREGIRWVSLY